MPGKFAGRYVPGMFDSPKLRYGSAKRKQTAKARFLVFCRKQHLEPTELLFEICKWTVNLLDESPSYEILQNLIGFHRAALSTCPQDHRIRGPILSGLGRGLCSLYMSSEDRADLREGTRLQRQALQITTSDPVDLPRWVGGMADSLMVNYEKTGKIDYLNEALAIRRDMLDSCVARDEVRVSALISMGNGTMWRYQHLGDITDLDKGIGFTREATSICQADSELLSEVLHCQAIMLSLRYLNQGSEADLREAIQNEREALSSARRIDDATRARYVNQLANDLNNRFDLLGSLEDIDECIAIRQQALERVTDLQDNGGKLMHNLANDYMKRFLQLGNLDDLDQAAHLQSEAQSLLSPHDHEFPLSVNNLANVLSTRYDRLGDHGDLEESIRLHRKAVEMRKPGDPRRSEVLNDLAAILFTRANLSEDPDDIRESTHLHREALKLRPTGHPYRSDTLNNLANVLSIHFRTSGDQNKLDEAIHLMRQALTLREEGHPDRSNSLNGLALVLHQRYERAKVLQDLDEIVDLNRQSLKLRPHPHPLRFHSLENLSSALRERYTRLARHEDVEEAFELKKDVLQITVTGHANRARNLVEFAVMLLDQKWPFYDPAQALACMLEATLDEHTDPRLRLPFALHALEALDKVDQADYESLRPRVLDVLLATVALLPRVAAFATDIRMRLDIILRAQGVAVEAASHALILSRPQTAVEVLEAGRALFWARSLSLRPPIDGLPPSLRAEFQELSREIEQDSWQMSLGQAPGELPRKILAEQEITRRRRQTLAFESLTARIRNVEGQERFLLPDTFEALAEVTKQGPIVVLVSSKVSCDAVIMRSGQAVRVSLHSVTQDWLRELSESLTAANRYGRQIALEERALTKIDLAAKNFKNGKQPAKALDILRQLWATVVKPIFDALALEKPQSHIDRPRLWWCPTGQFAFLPIHAAGDYAQGGECCSDYVIPSYTPTLTALLNARRSFNAIAKARAMTLLAAVPVPRKGTSLPATVEEIHKVKQVIPMDVLVSLPAEDDCTVDPVAGVTLQTMLDKLPQATILHLACHGLQHPTDPLESGFILRDDILTIAKLMPLPLPNAFLAFLSACETAKGDKAQPDQTVHLAATMLFAGFKSVVATMWSMNDLDGPDVAKTVYEQLFHESGADLNPDIVPRALDAAVRRLRSEGRHPSRWAPYIHIGI